MQQEQRTTNRVGRTKLRFQQSRYVPSSTGRTGLVQQRFEFRFPIARKLGGLTVRLLRLQSIDPLVSIGIDPTLNEAPTATETKTNLWLTPPLQGQHDCAIAVPLLGVRFLSNPLPKDRKILPPTKRYLHDGFLSDGDIADEQSAIIARRAQP